VGITATDDDEISIVDPSTGLGAEVKNEGGVNRLQVSGTIATAAVSDLFLDYAKNGGSEDMAVDGSTTPVVFEITAPTSSKDLLIQELRVAGNDNGIKFGQFMGINQELTTGIILTIKSEDQVFTWPAFKSTDDLKHLFTFRGGKWLLDIQSGRDDLVASTIFDPAIVLKAQGTYATDDYIRFTVNDNLTNIIELEAIGFGFER
jgi:hypothetical protein